jgi:tetratricopeptide (TPR) repeat protein
MTGTLYGSLAEALACQQAGRLDEAEERYGRVLEREPDSGDAWHLLGRVALQKGDLQAAAARVLQAIRRRPEIPAYHTSLGDILAAQHRERDAVACYYEALRLEPKFVPALVNLGNALLNQRLYAEACAWYWRAIQQRPECAEAFGNLGNALRSQGEYEEAVTCYREACALQPESAAAAVNLAAGLVQLRQYEEAERWARRALELQPGLAGALSNLSLALTGQQRLAEAEEFARMAVAREPDTARLHLNLGCLLLQLRRDADAEAELRRALDLKPGYTQAANNLAVALHRQGRNSEAATLCERVLLALPQYGEAWSNLGIVRQAQGSTAAAIACFDEALKRNPQDVKSHVCRSLSLLAEGRLEEGFAEYEWRWRLLAEAPRACARPGWDGEALEGRRILLWAEQGLGDTLQFVRFAAEVASRGGRVILEVQDCLASLARTVPGVARVACASAELAACDVQAPLLSLPRLVGISPAPAPYVTADPALVERVRSLLGPSRGLRVGVSWAGSRQHSSDRLRSLDLARLAPLGEIAGVEWHTLQVEADAAQAPWLGPCLVPSPDADYLAALMTCLDLIISVDTMTAHLAGALGRPVWTLLHHAADWRWGLHGENTRWYPAMRLFRQPAAGDWDAVVHRVARALRALIQASAGEADKEQ